MRDPWDDSELSRRFRESASTLHPRAPLYAALSAGIARDPQLYGLLHHAPPLQRLPVLLFASAHALLLAEPDHELASWYPNLTDDARAPDDPRLMAVFTRFVTERAPDLLHLLATRSTQTNEVGRCLMLMPALALAAADTGPIAHLDVGASGGLQLLSDRFAYHYVADDDGDDHRLGTSSDVVLTAHTRGVGPLPSHLPTIAARCGIDRRPIDITDDTEAQWLEACIWPDQTERFRRLHRTIELAREHPPEVLAGDAVTSLEPAAERLMRAGHLAVTTSWVLNYLPGDQRTAFGAMLDRIGATADVSWVVVESPALTPELPWPTDVADSHLTVTMLLRWRSGERTLRTLATSHPHGFWIHWH